MTFSSPIPQSVIRISLSGIVPILAGLWSTWVWYYSRLIDNSDEPLGAIALVTCLALGLLRRGEPGEVVSVPKHSPPATLPILLGLYCISLFFAPHMVSAIIAITIVVTGVQQAKLVGRLRAGDWLLLLLSLPVIASLNFYIGYPMRLAAGAISATLLNINGFQVIAQGTSLLWDGRIVDIDAPCSGIKMLWMSAYIAAALATVMRMDWRRSCLLAGAAFAATIFANAIRVSSLFYLETGVLPVSPAWHDTFHEGIGVASFLMLGAALLGIALWLAARQPATGGARQTGDAWHRPYTEKIGKLLNDGASVLSRPLRRGDAMHRPAVPIPQTYTRWTMVLCVVAASIPMIMAGKPSSMPNDGDGFPGWPQRLEGLPLTPLPMSSVNKKFLANFPGHVALFSNGTNKVVYRWVKQPTRQLHPAADCYRAAGYKIRWLPQEKTRHTGWTHRWAAFEATKGNQWLHVRERIYDEQNHTWTDVSDWYWSTLSSRSTGPWWAVCTYEPVVNGNSR